MTATLEEIRELSARTRLAQRWAATSLLATLALFPILAFVLTSRPEWVQAATWSAASVAGLLFVATAYVTGQSRGAFRRILKRVKADAKGARSRAAAPAAAEES